jgi:DNA-directed RNA polymerase subunit RPC12/RpoP
MKEYPRLGSVAKAHGNKRCKACGANQADRVDIQFTIFRGDDEVMYLCRECWKALTPQKIRGLFV